MLECILVFLTLLLDQGTKFLVMSELAPHNGGVLEIWPGVFHFAYLENRGAAFGMMENMQWLFLIITPIVAAALIIYLVRRRNAPVLLRIALALLLSGALGNLFDRVLLGYVRDFLYFALINFAVFNVADSCMTIGAVLFAWYVFFHSEQRKPDAALPEAEAKEAKERVSGWWRKKKDKALISVERRDE